MKIDFTQILKERNGQPMLDDSRKTMTIGRAVVIALDSPVGGSEKIGGEEKVKRFLLACKIHDAQLPVELTVDEAAKIKKLVDELYPSPLVVAPIWAAIEDAASEGGEKEESKVRKIK